jgi:hypothetical protein
MPTADDEIADRRRLTDDGHLRTSDSLAKIAVVRRRSAVGFISG